MPVFTEQMVMAGRPGGRQAAGQEGGGGCEHVHPRQVQQEQLASVMDWLTQQPRAAQLVDKDGPFLSTLGSYLSRYLKEVKHHHIKADKR